MSGVGRGAEGAPASAFVDLPGRRLHVLEWIARGPAAHFQHASGLCAGTYTPFLAYLAGQLHLIASDFRGHGDSAALDPLRIRSWDPFRDDLTTLVATRLAPPVVGIGHSMGAMVTLMAAAAEPQLFSALILIEPVFFPRTTLLRYRLMRLVGLMKYRRIARSARRRKRLFASRAVAYERFAAGRGIFRGWPPEFIQAYLTHAFRSLDGRRIALKCDPEFESRIYETVPLISGSRFRRVACPVLALRGAHSSRFQPEAGRRLAACLADCELQTVSGTGHFIPMERPGACARRILDFLKRKGLLTASGAPG